MGGGSDQGLGWGRWGSMVWGRWVMWGMGDVKPRIKGIDKGVLSSVPTLGFSLHFA